MTPTDQLAGKLLEIINQIQIGVVAHAPDAMNMVLTVTQLNCLQNIILSILGFIVVGIFIRILFKMKTAIEADKKLDKDEDEYDRLDWDSLSIGIPSLFMLIAGVFIIIFSCIGISDIWNWVGLFNPKVYLANEIIQKVMQ